MADTEQAATTTVPPQFRAIKVGAHLAFRNDEGETVRDVVVAKHTSAFDPNNVTVDTTNVQGITHDRLVSFDNPQARYRPWELPPRSYVSVRQLNYLNPSTKGTVLAHSVLHDGSDAVLIAVDRNAADPDTDESGIVEQQWVYLHQITRAIRWHEPHETPELNDARELAGRMLAFFTAHPHMHNQHAWVATADALTPPVDTGESDEASPYLPSVDEATPEQKQTHLCDTTLCAAGLAAYLSGYRLHPGNTVVTSYASLPGNPTAHLSIEDEAAKLLKLSTGARREMFSGATSESYVITMLRRLYLTGSVWRDGE